MKIYVAGASDETQIVRVKRWSANLTKAGWQVVSTWIENIGAVGSANPRDASQQARLRWAATCLSEVRQADAFWFLVPPPVATSGAWVELATAYESSLTIVCSGDTKRSIFTALGHEEEYDEDAFRWLQAAFDVSPRSRR